MRALWRRLDRALMLRAPRLWQSRLHQALALALPAHALVALLTLLLARPVFMSMTGDFASGRVPGFFNSSVRSAPQLVQLSAVYSNALTQRGEAIAVYAVTLGGLVLALSAIPALLLARSQNQHSIEAVQGRRNPWTAWLEWGGYALGSALFAALPLTVLLCLLPTPAQRAASDRVDAQSQAAALALLQERGLSPASYSNSLDGDRAWINLNRALADGTRTNALGGIAVIPAAANRPEVTLSLDPAAPRGVDQYVWQTAVSPAHDAYRADLREAAYVQAFVPGPRQFLPGAGNVWRVFQLVVFWWIVGLNGYFLYMRKRMGARPVVQTMAFVILGLPLISSFVQFFVLLLGSLLRAFSDNTVVAGMVYGLPMYALVAHSLTSTVIALTARVQRRGVGFGLMAGPIALALGLWVTYATLPEGLIDAALPGRGSGRDRFELLPYVLAMAPFLYVPLLWIIDRALVRHASLPREA